MVNQIKRLKAHAILFEISVDAPSSYMLMYFMSLPYLGIRFTIRKEEAQKVMGSSIKTLLFFSSHAYLNNIILQDRVNIAKVG